MHVLTLLGSPRKSGNSEVMARLLCSQLEQDGHEVEYVRLGKMHIQGCTACDGCKTKAEECVLQDDMKTVLDKARDADAWVLATPVYYAEVSAQLKAFIDRTYSFLVPGYAKAEVRTRLNPGKRLAMVIAQGHPLERLFADIFPRYAYIMQRYHLFREPLLFRACGIYDRGAAQARPELEQEARELARRLTAP